MKNNLQQRERGVIMDKNRDRDVRMHDRVRIKATGEIAYVVFFDEGANYPDKYLLEIADKNEMPKQYDRDEFEVI